MPLTTVSPGLLDSNAQYYGFKNRLINGAMGIWQRGTSFTPSSVVFGADRFASYKAGAAAGDYARSTNVPSGQGFTYSAYLNNADLRQSIELPGAGLPGDFVVGSVWTLSFWCIAAASTTSNAGVGWADGVAAGSLNYWGGVGQNFTVPTTWTRISLTFTVTGTPTGSQPAVLVYISSLGANAYVTGVQLEKGSTATSFDFRPYGTELMLCQRYYWQVSDSTNAAGFCNVYYYTTTRCFGVIPNPVQMRTLPTVTTSTASTFQVLSSPSAYPASSVAFYSATVNATTLDITTTASSAGFGGFLRSNASVTATLGFSAEL